MNYENETVMRSFRIYAELSRKGIVENEGGKLYFSDDQIRSLVDQFAREVDCTIVSVGAELHLIPLVQFSPFHVSNDALKRMYLKTNSVNADIYLMYVAIIAFIGSFYDSYQTLEPTREFILIEEWLELVQERIDTLKEHDMEELSRYEKDFSYNWSDIIEKWDDMDDIKETAKRQSGNTISRLSFIDHVRKFLVNQGLAVQIGEEEITITEKTKVIVQRFFMEMEINRGILQFLYHFKDKKESNEVEREVLRNASNI